MRTLEEIRSQVTGADGETYPGKSVVDYINRPAFDASKGLALDYILEIEKTSLLMLSRQKILSEAETALLAAALCRFPADEIRAMAYDRDYAEDMFFAVERKLDELSAGRASDLHLGRSRNDMMRTVDKMLVRHQFLTLFDALTDLIETLLAMARRYSALLMPGYTHSQQAQPLTLGHYLLGLTEILFRDLERLKLEFSVVQLCPMGAGALTTTSFPIDRKLLADRLGFDGLLLNSCGAVSSSDALTGSASAVAVLCENLGRFVMQLHVWSSVEYGILRPGRAYVGISSMMPQKRNPSTLEHVRCGLSECVGGAVSVLLMNHNTEYEGNIDLVHSHQTLQELLRKAAGNIMLLRNICATMDFDEKLLRERAENSFAVMTDFADFLVQREHIPYRQAHTVASRIVDACITERKGVKDLDEALLVSVFSRVTGRPPSFAYGEALEALDAEACVRKHAAPGGTSPEAVEDMLTRQSAAYKCHTAWLARIKDIIEKQKDVLNYEISSLIG